VPRRTVGWPERQGAGFLLAGSGGFTRLLKWMWPLGEPSTLYGYKTGEVQARADAGSVVIPLDGRNQAAYCEVRFP
jgi:hypothetical protein